MSYLFVYLRDNSIVLDDLPTPSNQKKWPYTNNCNRIQFINVVYFEPIRIATGILSTQLGVFCAHKSLTNKSLEISIINQLCMAYASIRRSLLIPISEPEAIFGSTPGFSGVRVILSVVFYVVFLDNCLSFWALYCVLSSRL